MAYRFCSICGKKLKKRRGGHLACVSCQFVNYRNPRPTATVLVLYKNKLLLTKRGQTPFKGWWDLPGGFVDRSEHPTKTAIRELYEETRLHINLKKLFGVYIGTYPHRTEPFNIVTVVYVASSPSRSLKAQDDVIDGAWFSKNDLPKKIAFDSNQKIIKDFLKVWK